MAVNVSVPLYVPVGLPAVTLTPQKIGLETAFVVVGAVKRKPETAVAVPESGCSLPPKGKLEVA